jgi:hypothetical protein
VLVHPAIINPGFSMAPASTALFIISSTSALLSADRYIIHSCAF